MAPFETVVVAGSEWIAGAAVAEFREALRRAAGEGDRIVELDLARTRYVDSAGMGALVSTRLFLESRSGLLRIRNASSDVARIIAAVESLMAKHGGGPGESRAGTPAKLPPRGPAPLEGHAPWPPPEEE